ncbi:hypothetical protein C4E24_08235 [ANME-1 cluster archaeon AG-394-G21]|nr:hypothetical protein [ANME-1 cluster archaeon AG-394-G21]
MEKIEKEFQKREPWITQFTIGGKKYGGGISFECDARIKQFFDCFPNVHSILDITGLSTFGHFDAIFCSGLLYHLPEPWKLIKEICNISHIVFIWTHYATEDKANEIANGFRGFWHAEGGIQEPLSGLSPRSFWVTLSSLKDMLKQYDFTNLKIIEDNSKHPNGSCVTLAAWKRTKI